jgi:hypothetical protein
MKTIKEAEDFFREYDLKLREVKTAADDEHKL